MMKNVALFSSDCARYAEFKLFCLFYQHCVSNISRLLISDQYNLQLSQSNKAFKFVWAEIDVAGVIEIMYYLS